MTEQQQFLKTDTETHKYNIMKQPFLEFLKQCPGNPIIVPKTDAGKYAICFDNVWYYDSDFGECHGFLEYGYNFAETLSMLEEIYYKYEIKVIK